ncbi:MAG: hypothetical protein DRO99_01700 [Candidatus Aenigmatarchaeota archaeon]|nr:MAG: hypothetical protein DRO99_01700 [Candidatus Aenigmarchaeota archaeon]
MIGIVNNFRPDTGIGKYAFSLIDRFSDSGREVELIQFSQEGEDVGRANTRVLKSPRYPIAGRTLSAYYSIPKSVGRGYELYHASSQYLARLARFRKPCVITHHDLAPLLFPDEYPMFLRFFVKKMIKSYKDADRIIAISEMSHKDLMEHVDIPKDKVSIIPHGFDNRLYMPMDKAKCRREMGLPEECKMVLHVGSEEPRKNIPLLLEAQRAVTSSVDDAILVRVGSTNKEYDRMKKGMDIRHFSNVPEEKMPLLYNSADVFVFPSRYEGFGYPVIEAMGCGIPTIVSKPLSMFSGGALVVPFDSPKIISDAIIETLTKDATAKRMSARAVSASREFTLDKEAERTWSLYQEVMTSL